MYRIVDCFVGLCLVTLFAISTATAQGLVSGQRGFGHQWVQNHPFMIKGLIAETPGALPGNSNPEQYWNANHTYVLGDESPMLYDFAVAYQKSWTGQIGVKDWTDLAQSRVSNVLHVPGRSNWILRDEPRPWEFAGVANIAAGIRSLTNGTDLIYGNVQGWEATHSTAYPTYLNDYFAEINPDAIQFDTYPFYKDGSTGTDLWFSTMMNIRNQAMGVMDIPYFGYLQSFSERPGVLPSNEARRESSESDMRMQTYSMLAAGYKGLTYFTHHYYPGETATGLVTNGIPGSMYPIAQDLNLEVQNLGRSLRFLESKAVRFVPGGSSSPDGLVNWTAGSGGVTSIRSITSNGTDNGEDGLIGFFTDDNDQHYFMLTNLNHGMGATSADKTLDFTITFKNTVNELLRLNRETGAQELIPLNNHVLEIALPGGTGDLFKFNTGTFAGIPEHVTGTTIFSENFNGYANNSSLVGQTGPNGQTWEPFDLWNSSFAEMHATRLPGQDGTIGAGRAVGGGGEQAVQIELGQKVSKGILTVDYDIHIGSNRKSGPQWWLMDPDSDNHLSLAFDWMDHRGIDPQSGFHSAASPQPNDGENFVWDTNITELTTDLHGSYVVDLDNQTVTYTVTSIQENSTATASGTYDESYAPSRVALYLSAIGAGQDNGYDNIVIRVVPEPNSVLLMSIAGIFCLGRYRRRRCCWLSDKNPLK